ncbi:cytochrome c maturation protein CcmE [Reinekea marina]|uniref:Cytochrome c-type biogenesis protein CcmE n=1 Tax=Reinekea marina TaxID=1310421 RepID=A0ABV7WSS1_9GAMM|nr:cytochrome c maturation protein CcmE [Reinekea marina]MDN3648899.1 cytochrome c maturation protein CcmE [Reinekea marina]
MNPKRKQRLMLILLGVAGVSAAVLLVLFAMGKNVNYFYTPSELSAGNVTPGATVRAGGMVSVGSVVRSNESLKVQFKINDTAKEVGVEYEGILPDLFREGDGVVVVGQMNKDNVLVAQEVLAKHDETYMPPEVTEAIEQAHQNSTNNN